MIIDDLPSISIANDSDEIAIEQGTATKKITKGNFLQEVTSAISSLLSSLSGKVSKAGDTMTGSLVDSANIYRKVNGMDSTATAEAYSSGQIAIIDKNDRYVGYLQSSQGNTAGTNADMLFSLVGRKVVNGSNVDNRIDLGIQSNGTRTVSLSSPAAWRDALGLEAVEFNLTRASAASNGSGYGIYDPGSKTVRINGWARNDTDITTGAAVFTIPSEYRPSSNKYGSAIIINSSGVATAYTIGVNASGSIYQSYTNTARQIKFYIEYKL